MHVTILDGQGNLIEDGPAIPCPDDPEIWAFLPAVRVTAMDRLRSVGMKWACRTVGEKR